MAPPRRLIARLAPALAALAVVACGSSGPTAGAQSPDGAGAPGATAAAAVPAAAGGSDWLTYHRDNARDGVDPSRPATGRPGRGWTSPALHGQVFAEPLIAGDRVIVATEQNWVYALSRRSGRVLWHRHVATPVPAANLPCGDIDPSGITGTPVIDPARGLLYAVAFTAGGARHDLVALSLRTGAIRLRRPVDAPGADPHVHQERGALSLSAGRVLIPYGGLFGDCGPYHGRVVSVSARTGTDLRSYRVPSGREAGIWAPSGLAVGASGSIFAATGNGSSTASFDRGNSVIRLSSSLREQSFFTTPHSPSESANDADLGSVGPSLLGDHRAFVVGKTGTGYLLDTDRLGGIGGSVASASVCGHAFGGLAVVGSVVYVACTDGVRAVQTAGDRVGVLWSGPSFNAGPPIVAGGTVWTVDLDAGRLVALSPSGGGERFSMPIGHPANFSTPAASSGLIVAAGGDRVFSAIVR